MHALTSQSGKDSEDVRDAKECLSNVWHVRGHDCLPASPLALWKTCYACAISPSLAICAPAASPFT